MSHLRPWFFLFLILEFIRSCYAQPNSQNLETFYPFPIFVPTEPPSPLIYSPPPNSSSSDFPPEPELPFSPTSPPFLDPNNNNSTVVKAVAATAVSTFVVATLLFFFVRKRVIARRKRKITNSVHDNKFSPGGGLQSARASSRNFEGSLKGLIIDENGLDVLYWRKLNEKQNRSRNNSNSFRKVAIFDSDSDAEDNSERRHARRKSEPIQEVPLLKGKSSASHNKNGYSSPDGNFRRQNMLSQGSKPPPSLPPASFLAAAIPAKHGPPPPSAAPVPPPPVRENSSIPPAANSTPPPPPPVQLKVANSTPPPPPPPPGKKANAGAPPPPPPPGKKSNSPPPPLPLRKAAGTSGSGGSSTGDDKGGNGQVKLKPLHWDKVNKNTEHSMVWDKIGGGSFRFDDDLMEALFGYVATNRKSPRSDPKTINASSVSNSPPAQITILDARKSHNVAIVLKSLAISRGELLDALADGHGLNLETLERLVRITPTKEEEAQILDFSGDIGRLADAESFLFHLLKAVPSAFTRFNAMLFRLNYDSEIFQYRENIQTLELGCTELRKRGLFVKLLEAILKAGNRMNAGTSRGNAQAFNLTSLKKLSDVKSTDGKTTLLHFIVEEVIQSEGKRCVINRNRTLNRSGSSISSTRSSSNNSIVTSENSESTDEKEKEYMMLGLPLVGGLSAEFSNVKKAAQVDYDTFAGTYSALAARLAEVRQITSQCAANGGGGFVKEMKGFLDIAEEELKILKEEEMRVMKLVRKTTEYYQAGATKNKGAPPLQLFVIIKDFLSMVDQVCIEITRNLQRKKTPSSFGSSPKSPASRMQVQFPNLPEHFMKDKSGSSSSESDSDF